MSSIKNTTSPADCTYNDIDTIIKNARAYRHSQPVRFDTLHQIQVELRKQRKQFMGSNVPLSTFLYPSGHTMHSGVIDLIEYLSLRTLVLWEKPQGEHMRFCRQFYELSFSCPNWVMLDDVILFATTLVHEKKSIFLYVMEELLPTEYHDLLHSFAMEFPEDFYEAPFEDAVLGAVSILLGVLKDTLNEEANNDDI